MEDEDSEQESDDTDGWDSSGRDSDSVEGTRTHWHARRGLAKAATQKATLLTLSRPEPKVLALHIAVLQCCLTETKPAVRAAAATAFGRLENETLGRHAASIALGAHH